MAGINAHNKINEKEPLVLKRSEAYIGVLIDDLVNKGTIEPYRMFTSRAEYRILLRQDNADLRLTEIGHKIGLADDDRLNKVLEKKKKVNELIAELEKLKVDPTSVNNQLTELKSAIIRERVPVVNFLKRPEIGMNELRKVHTSINDYVSTFADDVQEQAEIQVKYLTYIDREEKLAQKIEGLENYQIRSDFDYDRVKALSSEAREKLKKMRPETLGQASRISGVSPADISVLTIYMGK